MSGYQSDYSMSNRAVQAYENGLLPASKIKGVPAPLIADHCRCEEWHHASSRYNKVKFYDPEKVLAEFGICPHPDYEINPVAAAALEEHRAKRKNAPVIHMNCTVEWLEWYGSIKHPKCDQMKAQGCTVSVKGQTATVTLPDGKALTKRLSTRGFSFTQI